MGHSLLLSFNPTQQLRKAHLDEEIQSALDEKANLESRLKDIISLPQKVKDIEYLRQIVDLAFAKIPLRQREVLELLDVQCQLEWKDGRQWLHITSAIGSTLLHASRSMW